MSAATTYGELLLAGCEVSVDGGCLIVRKSAGLTDDLRFAVGCWHAEIAEMIRDQPGASACARLFAGRTPACELFDDEEYDALGAWFVGEAGAGRLPTQGPLVLQRTPLGKPCVEIVEPPKCWAYYLARIAQGGGMKSEVKGFLKRLKVLLDIKGEEK